MAKDNTNQPTVPPNGHTYGQEKLPYTLKPYQQNYVKSSTKTQNPDTSYQPNHSASDTTGQKSNIADYEGAPHTPQQQQQQTSSSENEEHTHNTNSNEWQEIRRTNRKKLNTHLPTLWTLHQKLKSDMTSFPKRCIKKKWRSIHNLTQTRNLRPSSYMG